MKLSIHGTEPKPPLPSTTSPRPMGADRTTPADKDPMADWWPEADEDRLWNDARFCDSGSMVILLSGDNRTAWLAVMPEPHEGRPQHPLLIHRWTVAGRVGHTGCGLTTWEPVSREVPMPQEPPDDGKVYSY